MSQATAFRDRISAAITKHGSTIIITPQTPTEGNYGGYEPGTDGGGTAVTTKGLPSDYLISKQGEPFGRLKAGEVIIVIKYDEVIEKDYKVTWKSENYTVEEIKEVTFQDVILGKRIKLSRKID